MNIALDATPLTVPTGGIVRYTVELALALARSFPRDNYWLVSDQPFPALSDGLPNLRVGGKPRNALERKWWSFGLPIELHRLQAGVFHGVDFCVPYLPLLPSVLTLHDLSPWRRPFRQASRRVRERTPFLLRSGLATMVITPTESIRREACEAFGLHPSRVIAVPLAASSLFRPVAAEPSRRPYFLCVSTLEPRKNLGVIVDAWRQVRGRFDVDLVLAGCRRDDFPAIAEEDGLRLPGAVADADLPGLYSGAAAFLYPSSYEGFGLPLLEAMQCGAAVFTSSDAALVEVGGEAAVQLDADDPRQWAEAMTAVLSRPEWRASLQAGGLRRAAQFEWGKTARATREVYDEAIRRF